MMNFVFQTKASCLTLALAGTEQLPDAKKYVWMLPALYIHAGD